MIGFTCKFYTAGCADAILIRFEGNDGQIHNFLVDSGSEEFYDVLRPELEEIAQRGENISFWVVTHWDNDHIGGIIKFLKDDFIRRQVSVNKFWFNANYRISKDKGLAEGFIGLKEGVLLRNAIQDEFGIHIPIITTETPPSDLFGTRLTILSPLPEIYQEVISKIQTFAPTGSKSWDYSEKIEALIKKDSPPDRRLENRSSIAFLLDYGKQRFLFLADASPVDLIPHLRRMGYSGANPLSVDFVKVAHHGSKRNTSKELLSLIDTDKFIFTADGSEKYKLPDKEAVACILCHPRRDVSKHIKLFFNHRNTQLENIFAVDGKGVYERFNFSVHFPEPDQNALIIHFL